MTTRKTLTDKIVQHLKPAAPGKRFDVYDAIVPNLIIRVTPTHRSYCLRARFPGSTGRPRRELGAWPTMTVEQARAKARRWLTSLAEGIDPQLAERRAEGMAVTFGDAVEQWLALRVHKRKARDVEREVRAYLVPKWGGLPIGTITRTDIKQLIAGIRDGGLKGEKPAPYQAHNVLGHVRGFYRWAVHEERFGLQVNPAREVEPTLLIGKKEPRERKLSDAELRAFWRAAGRMGYPYGPVFRLLLLTGCRNTEVRDARWREFDITAAVWRIPEERFKSGSEHLVALSGDALALLRGLPGFQWGDHLFSATFGRTAVHDLSRAKVELDRRMLRSLRALARSRGENAAEVELKPFVVHDLRRTVRTRLSSLRIPAEVAEMCMGHGRKGIERVYDLHHYEPEMRDAMERWAAQLRAIVAPSSPLPSNVVQLREAAN
jgi:integrase